MKRIGQGLRYSLILSVVTSLLIILYTVDQETIDHLLYIEPLYLFLALLLSIIVWLLGGLRLYIVARGMKEELSFFCALRVFLVGSFVSNITPFASGGGPFQVYLLHQSGMSVGKSTTLVVVQFVLRLLLFGLLGPLFYLFYPGIIGAAPLPTRIIDLGVLMGFLLSLIMLLVIYYPQLIRWLVTLSFRLPLIRGLTNNRRIRSLIAEVIRETTVFKRSMLLLVRREQVFLLLVTLATVLFWVLFFSIPPVLMMGLGRQPRYQESLIIQTIFYLILNYIPTPGGSGFAELGFASLFSLFTPPSMVGILTFVWRFLTYYLLLLVGGLLSLKLLITSE